MPTSFYAENSIARARRLHFWSRGISDAGIAVNGPHKWLKRGLWAFALFMIVAAGLSVMSYLMIRRTPDWYQADTRSADERSRAAGRIENLLILLRNWGGQQHAIRVRAQKTSAEQSADPHAAEQAKEALAEKADEAFAISFTDDELNAFFNKWTEAKNRREWFDQYVENPQLIIRGNQLIIAGKSRELDLVVSLVFEPRLDTQGNLDLHMTHVLGGILPLPDSMWSGKREALERMLQEKLPLYQQDAEINSEGLANGNAASAAMNEMLLATLQYKPSSAVIFVPIELQHLSQSLPVKITALSIHDHTIEMTAEQMSVAERDAFLTRLKSAGESLDVVHAVQ